MRRVLERGGALGLSVWSTPDRTMVVGIGSKTVTEFWPAALLPVAPTWFGFGPEGALEVILSDAGFKDIKPVALTTFLRLMIASSIGERF